MAQEKQFENRIKDWFHTIGIYPAGYPQNKMEEPPIGWYTKIWGGGYQKAGIPDIIACIRGEFLTIEVKAQNGKPSALQELNTTRIREVKGQAVFLYPSGFRKFKHDLLCNYFLKEVYK